LRLFLNKQIFKPQKYSWNKEVKRSGIQLSINLIKSSGQKTKKGGPKDDDKKGKKDSPYK